MPCVACSPASTCALCLPACLLSPHPRLASPCPSTPARLPSIACQAEAMMASKAEELLGNLWKLNVADIEKTLDRVVPAVLQVT